MLVPPWDTLLFTRYTLISSLFLNQWWSMSFRAWKLSFLPRLDFFFMSIWLWIRTIFAIFWYTSGRYHAFALQLQEISNAGHIVSQFVHRPFHHRLSILCSYKSTITSLSLDTLNLKTPPNPLARMLDLRECQVLTICHLILPFAVPVNCNFVSAHIYRYKFLRPLEHLTI